MRRSFSCALAGLLTVVPIWVIAWSEEVGWQPGRPRLIFTVLCFVFVVGIMWLYDEIHNY